MASTQVPISRRSGRQACQSLVSDAGGSSPDDEEFDTAPFPNNSASHVPQNLTSTPELGAGGRVTRLRSLMGALKKAIGETEHGSLVKVVCPEMDGVADSGLVNEKDGLGKSGEIHGILELQTPAVVGSGLDADENISDCGGGRPLENTLGLPGAIEPSYNPKGDRFWELTPLRRLSVGRRQNREFVGIYDYQELPDGNKVLGGDGITLDIADWRALCSALPEIREYLLDKNLETKDSKESKGGEKDVQLSLNAEAQKTIPKRSLRSNSGRVAEDVQQTECLLQKVLETPMKPINPSKTPKKSKLNPPSTDKVKKDVVAIKVSNNLCLKDKSINTAAPGVGQPKTPRRKSHRIAGKLSLSQKKRALEDEELEANAVPKKATKRVRWKTKVQLKIIGQDLKLDSFRGKEPKSWSGWFSVIRRRFDPRVSYVPIIHLVKPRVTTHDRHQSLPSPQHNFRQGIKKNNTTTTITNSTTTTFAKTTTMPKRPIDDVDPAEAEAELGPGAQLEVGKKKKKNRKVKDVVENGGKVREGKKERKDKRRKEEKEEGEEGEGAVGVVENGDGEEEERIRKEKKERKKEKREKKKNKEAALESNVENGVAEDGVSPAKEKKEKKEKKAKKAKKTKEESEKPESPKKMHDTVKDTCAAGYKQHPDLSALPKETIEAYLAEHVISIVDPHSSGLRPIIDFSYLTFDFSGFSKPTPIQAATWPFVLNGLDCIGVAETGSGKTLAFAVPAINHISGLKKYSKNPRGVGVKAVVVSPTRELAMQIYDVMEKYGRVAGLGVVCIYGGVSKDEQRSKLRTANIVVATPGRLNDLINEGCADLSKVEYLVLDEADRMLDKGFEEDIRRIISATPKERQTLMFTATWPQSVRVLASTFMKTPVKITIGDHGDLRANMRISQTVEVLDQHAKEQRLLSLIKQHQSGDNKNDRILVFCLYKKEATRVEMFLRNKGCRVAGIHGDLNQAQRTMALAQFKDGVCPLLIATDVAARGLDIPAVKLVINVTFPLTIEDYVHRIGRTGRAGADGMAYTFFTEHDKTHSGGLVNILKAAGQPVPESLLKFGTTVKKKEHSAYGAFYKDTEGAKTATKIKFD